MIIECNYSFAGLIYATANDRWHGLEFSFYEDGNLFSIKTYISDFANGYFLQFGPPDILSVKRLFLDGKCVMCVQYNKGLVFKLSLNTSDDLINMSLDDGLLKTLSTKTEYIICDFRGMVSAYSRSVGHKALRNTTHNMDCTLDSCEYVVDSKNITDEVNKFMSDTNNPTPQEKLDIKLSFNITL